MSINPTFGELDYRTFDMMEVFLSMSEPERWEPFARLADCELWTSERQGDLFCCFAPRGTAEDQLPAFSHRLLMIWEKHCEAPSPEG